MASKAPPNRWLINRIGLLNFWYYDEEEFHFSGGRLLLRGANGSGKSVTMQSFIPLMLDGNKSPERLDPFGSRARRLENYLLGEEESGEHDRTGYLFMEFRKERTGNYLTLGMGVHARRGTALDFWGFSLTDGRRVGKDFFLYKELGEKIPLTKQELKNRIGEGGEIYERQKDYMAMVNRLLFGFDQIEDYDELIKLLVQIRTPKLSKEFKPTVVYDILTNSLQALSDEDLRPMSEAIENMDNIESKIKQLRVSRQAAAALGRAFTGYNTCLLWEKASNYLQSRREVTAREEETARLKEEQAQFLAAGRAAAEELAVLQAEQEALEVKSRELMKHDSFRFREEIAKREKDLAEWGKERRDKEKVRAGKRERATRLRAELARAGEELDGLKQSLDELVAKSSSVAREIHFDEHFFLLEEFTADYDAAYSWPALKRELQRYREKVRKVLARLRAEEEKHREYDRACGELEKAGREKEEARLAGEKAERFLDEVKEQFTEALYAWRKQNRLLKPGDEEMTEVQRAVNAYPDKSYDDILAPLRAARERLDGELVTELSRLKVEREEIKKKLAEKETELAKWRGRREPEPERKESVARNRERLAAEGLPHLPFYRAVDFKEEAPEELRGRIEEALAAMGLLDALLVPGEEKERLFAMDPESSDTYLFPVLQLVSADLSSWLRPAPPPESGISPAEVDSVIRSIMTEERDGLLYLTGNGRFGVGGALEGQTSRCYQAKYIGIESRKRYREKIIAGLQEEIETFRGQLAGVDRRAAAAEEQRRQLAAEYRGLPGKDDLETAASLLQEARLTLENKEKALAERRNRAEECHKQLQEIRGEIRELARKMALPVNLDSFTAAEERLQEYTDLLHDLESCHGRFLAAGERRRALAGQLVEVEADLGTLGADLERLENRVRREEQVVRYYRELLRQTDHEAVQAEIKACISRLQAVPGERERAAARINEGKVKAEEAARRLETVTGELHFYRLILEAQREGFEQEYDLGYVTRDEPGGTPERAQRIFRNYQADRKDGKSREDYLQELQERYFEVRRHLADYSPAMEYIFNSPVRETPPPGRPLTAGEMEELAAVRRSLKRLDIKARIQGKEVNFFALERFLDDSIAENEKLLRESDRQLFEDILANTISKKIRARIYHSEQWVAKMNSLMSAMNTSSGLTFNLSWRSRPAETEDQMDTGELVGLLKSDVNLLRAEDFQRLAGHFRSKVNQARAALAEAGVSKTFHTLIKEILDYRQWFEFQLFYTKTGERKRELTNNAFDRFSGGEKAMAMYVPLFSAVYARYEGARPDAPRLISLDEAFAGVDENNIRDMFRLLEELELNFIINSQILWGDYDTVPALAICELVRPNNANYVSVIRYRWNGRVRELLTEAAG